MKLKQWFNSPRWVRKMTRKRYKCPFCNNRKVREQITEWIQEQGEIYTDYFCKNPKCDHFEKIIPRRKLFAKQMKREDDSK